MPQRAEKDLSLRVPRPALSLFSVPLKGILVWEQGRSLWLERLNEVLHLSL